MDSKHRDALAVIVGIIIALALFSAFSVSLFHKTPAVVLPSLTPSATPGEESGAGDSEHQRVEVTTETVQNVIATLTRPESYSRTVTVETLGQGEVFGVTTATVMADGGWTKTDLTLSDGRIRHSIVGEGTVYVWYGNESSYKSYPAGEDSDDLAQRIPTYEDVLELERDAITAAGYGLIGTTPCVYAAVEVEELGYTEKYWVSVETGLLVYAESSDGEGTVFYRMQGDNIEIPATPGVGFTLPGGETLHTTAPTG